MTRQRILGIIANHKNELNTRFGVAYLALFGSAARDEATDASDIDLLVEFDRGVSLFQFVDLQHYLERILDSAHVDLVERDAVHPALREIIYGEAVRAA